MEKSYKKNIKQDAIELLWKIAIDNKNFSSVIKMLAYLKTNELIYQYLYSTIQIWKDLGDHEKMLFLQKKRLQVCIAEISSFVEQTTESPYREILLSLLCEFELNSITDMSPFSRNNTVDVALILQRDIPKNLSCICSTLSITEVISKDLMSLAPDAENQFKIANIAIKELLFLDSNKCFKGFWHSIQIRKIAINGGSLGLSVFIALLFAYKKNKIPAQLSATGEIKYDLTSDKWKILAVEDVIPKVLSIFWNRPWIEFFLIPQKNWQKFKKDIIDIDKSGYKITYNNIHEEIKISLSSNSSDSGLSIIPMETLEDVIQFLEKNYLKDNFTTLAVNSRTPKEDTSKNIVCSPKIYFSWFDQDHPNYNIHQSEILLWINTLSLLFDSIIIPPSHLLRSEKAIAALSSKKNLFEHGILSTPLRDDTRDFGDFVELKKNDAKKDKLIFASKKQISDFLSLTSSYYNLGTRNVKNQMYLFKKIFIAGFSLDGYLYNLLKNKINKDDFDCLFNHLLKIIMNLGGSEFFSKSLVKKAVLLAGISNTQVLNIILDHVNYCYFYCGAVGNNSLLLPDNYIRTQKKQMQELVVTEKVNLIEGCEAQRCVIEGYDPKIFLDILSLNGISVDKIKNLTPEEVLDIRRSDIFRSFLKTYFEVVTKFNQVVNKKDLFKFISKEFTLNIRDLKLEVKRNNYKLFLDIYQNSRALWNSSSPRPAFTFLEKFYSAEYSLALYLKMLQSL